MGVIKINAMHGVTNNYFKIVQKCYIELLCFPRTQ